MIVDEKDKVHPAFVELIKQMTPREAVLFNEIFEAPVTPIIDLSIKTIYGNNSHMHI
jgi:hypothetical protein